MIHNHEVPGSIPGPATRKETTDWLSLFFVMCAFSLLLSLSLSFRVGSRLCWAGTFGGSVVNSSGVVKKLSEFLS